MFGVKKSLSIVMFIFLVVIVISCGGGGGGDGESQPTEPPPNIIISLTAKPVSPGAIDLSWNPVGSQIY